MRFLVFHLALCPSKYPRNEQGRLQRMRRFPLASFPCFYAHNKAAPISTKVEELTQESTRIFRLQPQMLSQRRRLPECWDLCCRSNERTYNRSPHRCSRRPVNKKFIKQKESKFNDTNTRTRFHEGNIPYKVGTLMPIPCCSGVNYNPKDQGSRTMRTHTLLCKNTGRTSTPYNQVVLFSPRSFGGKFRGSD